MAAYSSIPYLRDIRNGRRRPLFHVTAGALEQIDRIISPRFRGRSVFVVTDSNVRRHYSGAIRRAFGGHEVSVLGIVPGESSKSLATAGRLQGELLRTGVERNSLLIALGGGVVGDIGGYVAATVLRGIPYVQIPTSLLAQVDSSIGGKVGVNHKSGKNLIGAFYPPVAIVADPSLLRTLPVRQFRNGLAEVVKIAFACRPGLFTWLERSAAEFQRDNTRVITELVRKSASVKWSVVRDDPFDTGPRAVLNFGHTVGHALEQASRWSIPHGEAVAIGMAVESRIAVEMGFLGPRHFERLISLLHVLKLPSTIPASIRPARIKRALAGDKKKQAGETRFALPFRPGGMKRSVAVPSVILDSVLRR